MTLGRLVRAIALDGDLIQIVADHDPDRGSGVIVAAAERIEANSYVLRDALLQVGVSFCWRRKDSEDDWKGPTEAEEKAEQADDSIFWRDDEEEEEATRTYPSHFLRCLVKKGRLYNTPDDYCGRNDKRAYLTGKGTKSKLRDGWYYRTEEHKKWLGPVASEGDAVDHAAVAIFREGDPVAA